MSVTIINEDKKYDFEDFGVLVMNAYYLAKILDERAPENSFKDNEEINCSKDHLIEKLMEDIMKLKKAYYNILNRKHFNGG